MTGNKGGIFLISLENVSKVYRNKGAETIALQNIDLTIEAGEIFGVIGLSGAGKSTLIRTINYLEKPTTGDVKIEGKSLSALSVQQLRSLRKNIGMIFQHFHLLETKTVYQNVAIPLVLNKEKRSFIEERVYELLSFVGLGDKASHYPKELSGGQKQRVGIARALATNPSILLCDEATSALDPETTRSILQLLKKINKTYGITILMITHEMEIVQHICDRVAVMHEGKIVEINSVRELFTNPQHELTKRLMDKNHVENLPISVLKRINRKKEGKIIKLMNNDQANLLINNFLKMKDLTVDFLYTGVLKGEEADLYMILHLKGEERAIEEALIKLNKQHLLLEEVL